MATGIQDELRSKVLIALSSVALLLSGMSNVTRADDGPKSSSKQSVSEKLIEDVAKQIKKFCKAKNVSTVQVVGFKGSIGTRPESEIKQEWLDTLKKHGIGMRKIDSTRLSGAVITQELGEDSLVLLTCTLTDNRGTEICTFRVRKLVPTDSLSQATPVIAQVTP